MTQWNFFHVIIQLYVSSCDRSNSALVTAERIWNMQGKGKPHNSQIRNKNSTNMNQHERDAQTEYLKSYACPVNMFIQYIPQACNKRILVTRNHKMLMEKHEKENSWTIPERKLIIMTHISARWVHVAKSAIHYTFNTQGDIMLYTNGEHFYRKISHRYDAGLLHKEKLTKILNKEWVIIICATTCHICVQCDGEKKKQAILLLTCMDIIWKIQFFFSFHSIHQ